jgi:hypothetical protein
MARVTITLSDSKKRPGEILYKMVMRCDAAEGGDSAAVETASRMMKVLEPVAGTPRNPGK